VLEETTRVELAIEIDPPDLLAEHLEKLEPEIVRIELRLRIAPPSSLVKRLIKFESSISISDSSI